MTSFLMRTHPLPCDALGIQKIEPVPCEGVTSYMKYLKRKNVVLFTVDLKFTIYYDLYLFIIIYCIHLEQQSSCFYSYNKKSFTEASF